MMRTRLILLLASSVPMAFAMLRPAPQAAPEKPVEAKASWVKDIRPILQKSCLSCHSGRFAAGKLRLGTPEELQAGGASGPLYTAKKPEESQLFLRVTEDTPAKPIMPPGDHRLKPAEVDAIRRWIAQGAAFDAAPVDYAREVLPILKAYCLPCHSGASPAAGYDMSSPEGLRKGGISGAGVVPGKPEESNLILRASPGAPGMEQMPPGEKKLSPAQITTLRNWVLQGASTAARMVDYKVQVEPIIGRWCLKCHSPEKAEHGLDMSTPAAMLKGGKKGPLYAPGKADESLFIRTMLGDPSAGAPMPPEEKVPEAEIQIIRDWINQGAKADGDPAPPEAASLFARDVAPIFKAYCSGCHGAESPKAGLDLMTPAKVREAVASGRLAQPGDPAASELIRRVKGQGGKPLMPKGMAPLKAEDIAKLEAWIQAGAAVDEAAQAPLHWSYIAPVRPAVPPGARSPVDAFIQARWQEEGVEPNLPADPEAQIRRLTLDLTGLPPTLEEIDAFAADKSPDAWAKAVDRLLKSPHHGERMARVWLDLARYADTNGYEKDQIRSMWPWRDWVIAAFNRNMPFDEFTIQQIAGDLLPSPTLDQLIATGFHRNTMQNLEGGVQPEEAHHEVVMDRANTTSAVWLGQTMECARCHDHKFDPISQEDYYRFYAFFNNAELEPRGRADISEMKLWEASLRVPTADQARDLRTLEGQQDQARAALRAESKADADRRKAWAAEPGRRADWKPVSIAAAASEGGASLEILEGGRIWAGGLNPARDAYRLRVALPAGVTALRITALPDPRLGGSGSGRTEGGNFVLSRLALEAGGREAPYWPEATFVQGGYSLDGLTDRNPESGWAIGGGIQSPQSLGLMLSSPWPGGEMSLFLEFASEWPQHVLGSFRLEASRSPWPLTEFLKTAERGPAEFARVDPLRRVHHERLRELARSISSIEAAMPETRIMRDRKDREPKAPIFAKGAFASPEGEVEPAAPSVLPPLPAGQRPDRLALARWLVSRENPLTARVHVNRLWEMVWGIGLVKTSEDFGTQGEPPSHPELLDWLAVELMESGWDSQRILRLIVSSRAYRLDAQVRPDLRESDPDNRLMARGPRQRLEAEAVRDSILAASGLLSPRVGGPSVMPPQPEGIWNSPYSGEQWRPSEGANAWRRSLYTFWKRTAAYPALAVFDATSREQCTVRRQTTNTPLQALNLLNDSQYIEAAKALGRRMAEGGGVIEGFRRCTSRWPSAAELGRLEQLRQELAADYRARPEAAAAIAGTPEMAAWTMTANVLLNLDETISK